MSDLPKLPKGFTPVTDDTIPALPKGFSLVDEKKNSGSPVLKRGLPPLNSGSSPFQDTKPLAPTVLSGEKQKEFTEANQGYVQPKVEKVPAIKVKPEKKGFLNDIAQAIYVPSFNQGFSELVVKPLAGGTDFIDRSIDKIYQTVTGEETPEWLRKQGGFDKLHTHFEEEFEKRDKPTNLVSEVGEGLVGTLPLIASMYSGQGEANILSHAPQAISKLTKLFAVKGALNSYKDATDEGKGYLESLNKSGHGFMGGGKEGLALEAQMMVGGAMGSKVSKILAERGLFKNNEAVKSVLHALSIGTVFGGTSAGTDVLNGRDINGREAAKQFGMGLAFEIPGVFKGVSAELGKNHIDNKAVEHASLATSAGNMNTESLLRTLITTPAEKLHEINTNIKDTHDNLYAQSIEQGAKAYEATDGAEKRHHYVNQLALKTQGDVKLAADRISANKDEFIRTIQGSEDLAPEAKQDLINKINVLAKPEPVSEVINFDLGGDKVSFNKKTDVEYTFNDLPGIGVSFDAHATLSDGSKIHLGTIGINENTGKNITSLSTLSPLLPKGKGIGTEMYENMLRQATENAIEVLSDNRQSGAAEAIWEKMVKKGLAVKEGDRYKNIVENNEPVAKAEETVSEIPVAENTDTNPLKSAENTPVQQTAVFTEAEQAPKSEQVLAKAEDDLSALKQVADKSKKYEGSMKRLVEAKKAGHLTEPEFNALKQRFDDVMADSNEKTGKVADKPAEEEVQEEPVEEKVVKKEAKEVVANNEVIEKKLEDFIKTNPEFIALQNESDRLFENARKLSNKRMVQFRKGEDVVGIDKEIKGLKDNANKLADESITLLTAEKERLAQPIQAEPVLEEKVAPELKAEFDLIRDAKTVKSETNTVKMHSGFYVPESVAKKAYEDYHKKYPSQPYAELIRRGGFSADELDMFYSKWREEMANIAIAKFEKHTAQPKPDSSAETAKPFATDSGTAETIKEEPSVSKNKTAENAKPDGQGETPQGFRKDSRAELTEKDKPDVSKEEVKAGDPLRSLADKIEAGKINKLGGFRSGSGFDLAWDGSLTVIAGALRAGATLADAIQKGLDYIRKDHKEWYEGLEDQKVFDDAFNGHFEKEYAGEEKTKPKQEAPKAEPKSLKEDAGSFESLAHAIPDNGELKDYLSGETISKYEGEDARNDQSYEAKGLMLSAEHGQKVIESAKAKFGEDYVAGILSHLEGAGSTVDAKALIYVSLENDLAKRKLSEPENELSIAKLQDLVRAKSQAYLRANSIAINMGRLRKLAEVGYDLQNTTDQFFSTTQKRAKHKVEKALQADADAINKEAEVRETEVEAEGDIVVEKPKVVRTRKIVDAEIKDTLKGLRAAMLKVAKGGFGAQASIPFAAQIQAATPFIIKLSKLLAEKGTIVTKEMVAEIHKEIKQYIPKIKVSDIEQVLREEAKAREEAEINNGIKAVKKSIEELEQRLAENRLDPDTKTESLWSTELGQLKTKQAELQQELADRRKAAKPPVEPKEREPLTNEQRLVSAKRKIKESIENIEQEIAEKKRILKLTNKTVADPELTQLQAEKNALVKLRDDSDFGRAFTSERVKEAIAKRLMSEVEKINEQILAGEKAEREAKKDPYQSEKINKLKAEKKARLAVLEEIDPTPKQFVKDALIKAGFGREITVTTKDGKEKRQVIDWKKLAGEEGSEAKLQAHVEKALTDKGFSAGDILRMKDAFVQEYRTLRESIVEKSLKELNDLNTKKPPVEYRSSAKRLAELYNLGLFEKESDTYDYLMNKALGMSELSQESFFKAKELAKVLSDLYKQKDGDHQISEFGLSHAITDVNKKIESLLAGIAWHESNGVYKAAMITREIFAMSQRALLQSMKQALENPLSGYFERGFSKLTFGLEKNDTPELRKQRAQLARNQFGDSFSKGGMDYGSLNNPFLSKSHTEDWLNNLSKNKTYHRILSTALGKAYLEGMDGMHKVALTEGYFTRNLIKIATNKNNPNGAMTHDEAVRYVSEQLTGQKFDEAKALAKQVIDNINTRAGRDILSTNPEYVSRLAQGIVKDALVKGQKFTLPQIEASFKAGYNTAGHGLGHEQNNIISWGVGLLNHGVESRIKEAVKDKDWNRAAFYTFSSVMTKNILNPFVGGGMNWVTLTLQKSGLPLGVAEALVNKGKPMDLSTDQGIRDMEKALAGSARAKGALGRVYIGLALSFITVAALKASGEEDELDKWLKANPIAAKYFKIISPQAMIASMAIQSDEVAKYFEHLFNMKVDAYDDGINIGKGLGGVTSANPVKRAEGQGRLAAVLGGHLSFPVLPYKMGKDLNDITNTLKGHALNKTDYNVSGIGNGFFRTGMAEFMGLRPDPTYKRKLTTVIPRTDVKILKFLEDKELINSSGSTNIISNSGKEVLQKGGKGYLTASQAEIYDKTWNETFYKEFKDNFADISAMDKETLSETVSLLKKNATRKAQAKAGVQDAKLAELTDDGSKKALSGDQISARQTLIDKYLMRHRREVQIDTKHNIRKKGMSEVQARLSAEESLLRKANAEAVKKLTKKGKYDLQAKADEEE